MALQKEKTPMKSQDPKKRVNNFKEVPLGYTDEEAMQEAERCLQCEHQPCVNGCPVRVPIPQFIKKVKEGEFSKANNIIKSKNNLPAVCGRVCPQEEQCEKVCVMGEKFEPVAIGKLERFVSDKALENEGDKDIKVEKQRDEKVAVVGAGPAGLTAAADLAKEGFSVTLFESLHATGGVLRYGIPQFRLPKEIVDQEVELIKKLGVEIKLNTIIGKTLTIDELFENDYKAVFIGAGAGLPRFLGLEGENLNGVYSANEYLTRVNLMKAYKFPEYKTPIKVGNKVAVIGGGNVAMDSARTAKRLGAKEVTVVYRRSEPQMPARNEEIEHAKEEGIEFKLLNNPVAFYGKDGTLTEMKCQKMELGKKDDSGRRRPIPVENSNWIMDVDIVIIAIGQRPNPVLTQNTRGLETRAWGGIKVDDSLETTRKGVFAGGDVVTGAATVIKAMGAGKEGAKNITKYIESL